MDSPANPQIVTDALPPTGRPTPSPAVQDAVYGADYFDRQLHRDHWFRNNAAKRALRWREILRMLEPAPGDRVLEVGCAAGVHTLQLAPLCREVVGVDFAQAAVERAQARASANHVTNARFLHLDATDLSTLADASFDKIAAIDFFEHIDDRALLAVLADCRRLLRTGGRLVIFTPCASHYVERMKAHNFVLRQLPGHVAVRGPEAYAQLLATGGFAISSLRFSPSTYPLFRHLDRWLANAPWIGPWFRFRICIVATPTLRS